MANHEAYPNAPLRLVVAEYRFPHSPTLANPNVDDRLAESLGDLDLPIVEPLAQNAESSSENFGFRFLSLDRTVAATVQPTRLAVETTRYNTWKDFQDKYIRKILTSICIDIGKVVGLERIGLRYINEIRVLSKISQPKDWHEWINADLLTPLKVAQPTGQSMILGQLGITTTEHCAIHLWFGMSEGHVIEDGILKLPNGTGQGPFFLLDIDSFWINQGNLEKFDLEKTIATSNKLHQPINQLFETCITEKLRNEVLRRV